MRSTSILSTERLRSKWFFVPLRMFLVTATIITWLCTMETRTWAAINVGEQDTQPPEPIILPIPRSGDEKNPYFVNMTSTRETKGSPARSDTVTTAQSYDKHHRGYYLVTTNYPWSVVLSDTSDNNRTSDSSSLLTSLLQKTSRQAASHHCDIVATNGGPFDKGGRWNSGPTVSEGRLIRTKPCPEKSQFFGFGIAFEETPGNSRKSKKSAKHRHWIMGQYGQLVRSSSSLSIWDFVTGFGWLVYNGRPRVTSPNSNNDDDDVNQLDPTGATRAPRTAVGLDKDSNLMLLVVDGCQNW